MLYIVYILLALFYYISTCLRKNMSQSILLSFVKVTLLFSGISEKVNVKDIRFDSKTYFKAMQSCAALDIHKTGLFTNVNT